MSADDGDTAALVALTRDGSVTIDQVRAAGDARTLLDDRHGLLAGERQQAARQEIDAWAGRGIRTLGFDAHPAGLADMEDPPPLLWVRGDLQSTDVDGVAVIGTRRPTGEGRASAERIASQLVEAGITVISGLATGIDTVAHSTALRAGGRTIAVLGNGHDHSYPPSNAQLQTAVQATVSPFPPYQPPGKDTFPRRNAVMSAISRASVIVEAGEYSGVRIQARHALQQGRRLILLRSLINNGWARTLASQAGVRVIGTEQELIDAL